MGCSILPFIRNLYLGYLSKKRNLYLGWAVPKLHKQDGRDNTDYTLDIEGITNGNRCGACKQNKAFIMGGRPSSKLHLILLQIFSFGELLAILYIYKLDLQPPF